MRKRTFVLYLSKQEVPVYKETGNSFWEQVRAASCAVTSKKYGN